MSSRHVLSDPSIPWRVRTRLKQIARAILTGATAIDSLVLAILSVALAVYGLVPSRANWPVWLTNIGPWLFLILFFASLWFVSWRALHQLPPQEFARVAIGGLSPQEVLQLVAYEIWKVSSVFSSNILELQEIAPDGDLNQDALTGLADSIRRHAKRLERRVRGLKRLVERQQGTSQRITAMKYMVAAEFGTPPRSLCDHVFQFSPSMHQARAAKFVRNWEDILANHDQLTRQGKLTSRLRGLVEENRRIFAQLENRVHYQRQILVFRDLLHYIYGLASEHSTTGALRNYAQAISHAVLSVWPKKGRRRQAQAFREISERLRFLYFKQRVHPGFDLHQLCIRICEVVLEPHLDNHGAHSGGAEQDALLKRLRDQLRILKNLEKEKGRGDPFSDIDSDKRSRYMEALGGLSSDLTGALEAGRSKILENFVKFYNKWKESVTGTPFLLTHGYSKTVRDAFRHLMERLADADRPRIFVMASPGEESPDFDTRLMTYELRQSVPIKDEVAVGGQKLLLSLVDPQHTPMLVVLGAECFDARLRVIHPLGMTPFEMALPRQRGTLSLQFVVLAEEYKFVKSLLDVPAFFQHHLDRISLYDQGEVDLIISEKELRRKES